MLKLVPSSSQFNVEDQSLLIHSIRTSVLYIILFSVITYQLFQKEFINVSVWLPVYITLIPPFAINSSYLLFYERIKNHLYWGAALFALDAVVFSLLIHFTGAQGSLFFLLYLINIVLSGFLFSRWAVFALAFWTSITYSFCLFFESGFSGQSFYINLLFNNAALMAVAGLSSLLSDQFSFLGEKIEASNKKIEVLEDLNSLIVGNISSGLVTLNENLNVVTANAAAAEILNDSNLQGQALSSIFPHVYQSIRSEEVGKAKGSTQRFELAHEIEASEAKLILEVNISPLVDSDNQFHGYLILFQDLTEIKQMEKQVRQQDKLAAVGQLAAGIAHEIRNPLASISGSIQLLVANPETLKDEDLKLMRIVLREIDRLNSLISEFLDFVRPDVQVTESVSITGLMKEVLEMVRFNKGLPQDVDQQVEMASKMPVLGHRDKLKQAFLNVVINSYQAMADSDEKVLKVRVYDDSNKLKVEISDTGCGIDEKTLERIFEPFLTTKPKGTGLGLAITHKVFESHGAQVQVDSEKGVGTKFFIEFPFGTGPQPQEDVANKPAFGTA
jgi:two-component system sensor histidine kinase PilS (NtrC family)